MDTIPVYVSLRFGKFSQESLSKITDHLYKQGHMGDAVCLISPYNYHELSNNLHALRGYSPRLDSPGLTDPYFYSRIGNLRIGFSRAITDEEVHILLNDEYFIFTDKIEKFNDDVKEILA